MRIVINPGHSQEYDPGAPGPPGSGLTEAWVVTHVARALVALGGYEAKRQGRFLLQFLLALRANKPDVVVSLHCNAGSTNRHECHVYYWREEPRPDVLRESQRLCDILARKAQGNFAERGLVKTFPIERARAGGGSYLLTPGIVRGTAKRAVVLVELGFITDPHFATQAVTPSWHGRAAAAIDAGIREWML